MRPGQLEIRAELHQVLPLLLAQRRLLARLEPGDLAFDPLRDLQRLVPAALQLAGHKAIGRIDGIILSTRMGGLETRLLQRQLQLPLGG